MVLAMVLDLVDTLRSTVTGPASLRLSYTNVYAIVKPCFLLGLQKVGVEDEKKEKKSGPSPLYSRRGFLRSSTFSFLFFRCGRQRQTRSSRSKPRHTPPPVCGFTFHWLCPPLQSPRIHSNHIVHIETFTQSNESPSATILPPKKNPNFEDFRRALMGNTRLQGPYSQMNYGARLQLKI